MNNIYINGKFLCQKITGVQRFAFEIVKVLDNYQSKDLNFIILSPNNIINKYCFKKIKINIIGGKGNYYWEQITLPKYLKKNKIKNLINLCNLAPIKFPGMCVIHDLGVIEAPKGFSWKQRFIYKIINRINIKRYSKVFTVSKEMKEHIQNYYKISNVEVLGNGYDHLLEVKENAPNVKLPEKYILAVSSQNPNKNFKSIINYALQNPNLNFVIAGCRHKSFKKEKLYVPSNVLFLGYVSDENLVFLYKHCSAFIFPSTYEGFGIPPLEAIAMGCKNIICNDIPVLRELYSNCCQFVDFKSKNYNIKLDFNISEYNRDMVLKQYRWIKVANPLIDYLEKNIK